MYETERKLKPSKNQIIILGDLAAILLDNGMRSIIDAEDVPRIRNYKWRAVKASRLWYCKTTVGPPGKRINLSLHRMIAKTPKGQVPHHDNRDSMNNRKTNLKNMTQAAHSALHEMNNLIVKFEQKNR